MVSLRADEWAKLNDAEKKAHLENERKNVFGHDYKTDRHGKPIEQGVGSPSNPTIQSMNALRAAEGDQAADAAIERARKAGTWPPKQHEQI